MLLNYVRVLEWALAILKTRCICNYFLNFKIASDFQDWLRSWNHGIIIIKHGICNKSPQLDSLIVEMTWATWPVGFPRILRFYESQLKIYFFCFTLQLLCFFLTFNITEHLRSLSGPLSSFSCLWSMVTWVALVTIGPGLGSGLFVAFHTPLSPNVSCHPLVTVQ